MSQLKNKLEWRDERLTALDARRALRSHADSERAKGAERYFKTGKGEYGEGDVFVGVAVPPCRRIAKAFRDLSLDECEKLLVSKIHEERLVALLILVAKMARADEKEQKRIFDLYLRLRRHVNNWDLVDTSAPFIVGSYLFDRDRRILETLARSKNLWDRRIAMLATFSFIRKDDFADALAIAERLLDDDHDLIHKAVGWMLREIGERNRTVERSFLDRHASRMPRTMLRYAIEKFPEPLRKSYLARRSERRKGSPRL